MDKLQISGYNTNQFGDIQRLRFNFSSSLPRSLQPFSNVPDVHYLLPTGYQEFEGKDFAGASQIETVVNEKGSVIVSSITIRVMVTNTRKQIMKWYRQFENRNLIVEAHYDTRATQVTEETEVITQGVEKLTQNPMQLSMNIDTPEGIENSAMLTLRFDYVVVASDIFSPMLPTNLIAAVAVACTVNQNKAKLNFTTIGGVVKTSLQMALSKSKAYENVSVWKTPVAGSDDFVDVPNGKYYFFVRKPDDTTIFDAYEVTVACKYCRLVRLQITKRTVVQKPSNLVDFDPTNNATKL